MEYQVTNVRKTLDAKVFLDWIGSDEFANIFANALPGFFPLSNAKVTLSDDVAQTFVGWRGECQSTIRNSYQILSRGTPNLENDLWNLSAQVINGTVTPEDDLARLAAYSEGVNRYIERCGRKLPWEFRVLRYEPEPWRPSDTLLIGKGFAFLLTTALFSRINMIAIADKLRTQPDRLRSLFPMYPQDAPTITRAVIDSVEGLFDFANGTFTKQDFHPAEQALPGRSDFDRVQAQPGVLDWKR